MKFLIEHKLIKISKLVEEDSIELMILSFLGSSRKERIFESGSS